MPGGPSLPSRYQLVLFSFCLYVLVLTVNISKALLYHCVHTSCLNNKLLNAKSMFVYWLTVITFSWCSYVYCFFLNLSVLCFFSKFCPGKSWNRKEKIRNPKKCSCMYSNMALWIFQMCRITFQTWVCRRKKYTSALQSENCYA